MINPKFSIAVLLVLLASAEVAISAADAPLLNRAQLAAAEQNTDAKMLRLWNDNSLSLVGESRAVYLPGLGLVVSAEINLVAPTSSLLGDAPTDKDKADLKRKKAERLPILHSAMKEVMANLAASATQVPSSEQIALTVILPRFQWESGIPKQVTMLATKADLLGTQRDKAIRIIDTN
jgi:hypothetical protein